MVMAPLICEACTRAGLDVHHYWNVGTLCHSCLAKRKADFWGMWDAIFADRWRCAWQCVGEAIAWHQREEAGIQLVRWKLGDDPIDWNEAFDRARAWLAANREGK